MLIQKSLSWNEFRIEIVGIYQQLPHEPNLIWVLDAKVVLLEQPCQNYFTLKSCQVLPYAIPLPATEWRELIWMSLSFIIFQPSLRDKLMRILVNFWIEVVRRELSV